MKIKTGDTVFIRTGKDKGRKGKVIRVFPGEGKVVVEGINIRKKHVRPRKSGEKGQVAQMPAPFEMSNVAVLCQHCKKPSRIGYKIEGKTKSRICKKCKEAI